VSTGLESDGRAFSSPLFTHTGLDCPREPAPPSLLPDPPCLSHKVTRQHANPRPCSSRVSQTGRSGRRRRWQSHTCTSLLAASWDSLRQLRRATRCRPDPFGEQKHGSCGTAAEPATAPHCDEQGWPDHPRVTRDELYGEGHPVPATWEKRTCPCNRS